MSHEKGQRDSSPTRDDARALRRAKKDCDEAQRWDHYRAIPQKHWREMSGRSAQVINAQAGRYGIPFDGATIDLSAVVRALHDFLASHAKLLASSSEIVATRAARDEAEHRKVSEDAALKRIRRLILEGQYVQRDLHRRAFLTYALLVRDKIEEMVEGLPAALEGQSVGKIRFLLQDWYDRFCETLQSVNRVDLSEEGSTNIDQNRPKHAGKAKAIAKRYRVKTQKGRTHASR